MNVAGQADRPREVLRPGSALDCAPSRVAHPRQIDAHLHRHAGDVLQRPGIGTAHPVLQGAAVDDQAGSAPDGRGVAQTAEFLVLEDAVRDSDVAHEAHERLRAGDRAFARQVQTRLAQPRRVLNRQRVGFALGHGQLVREAVPRRTPRDRRNGLRHARQKGEDKPSLTAGIFLPSCFRLHPATSSPPPVNRLQHAPRPTTVCGTKSVRST